MEEDKIMKAKNTSHFLHLTQKNVVNCRNVIRNLECKYVQTVAGKAIGFALEQPFHVVAITYSDL
jgi:hypothetical protein